MEINKKLFRKAQENISNRELLDIAKKSSSKFTGIVSNNGNIKDIRRTRKFIVPSSLYGMRYKESSSTIWDLREQGMDLFITDKYGILKNDINTQDSLSKIKKAKEKSQKVIYFFGGSTMMSQGSRLPYFSIASLVEKLLNIKSGDSYACINFGIGGTCCQEAINLLINRSLKMAKPDLVIFYDGWNCSTYLTLRSQLLIIAEKYNLDLPFAIGETIRQLEHNITLDKVFNYSYCLSRLLKMSIGEMAGLLSIKESKLEVYLGRIQERFFSLRTHKEVEKLTQLITEEEIIMRSIVEGVSDYISIHQYAKAITNSLNIKFMTFLQPLTFWGSKKLSRNEIKWNKSGYSSGNTMIYKSFKEELLSTIMNKNIVEDFIDLTSVFNDYEDELYIDTGHINRLGNLIISERISSEILKRI